MKIKLWMTQGCIGNRYYFSKPKPIFDADIGIWFSVDEFGVPGGELSCSVSEIPEHLRFPEGGAKAIRLVELDITINGVEEAGQ